MQKGQNDWKQPWLNNANTWEGQNDPGLTMQMPGKAKITKKNERTLVNIVNTKRLTFIVISFTKRKRNIHHLTFTLSQTMTLQMHSVHMSTIAPSTTILINSNSNDNNTCCKSSGINSSGTMRSRRSPQTPDDVPEHKALNCQVKLSLG